MAGRALLAKVISYIPRSDAMDKDAFKDLCERFAMGLDELCSSYRAKSISHGTFKDICKSIAKEVCVCVWCR